MKKKEREVPVFEQYQQEIMETVDSVLGRVNRELVEKEHISTETYPSFRMQKELSDVVGNSVGAPGVFGGDFQLQAPPSHVEGDFAIETFGLAKKLKVNPQLLSSKIVDGINNANEGMEFVEKASAAGPFVNVEARKSGLYASVLSCISSMGDRYGESDVNAKKVAVIDFSSPNIAKPMGVGHLRSTIIGQALANLYEKTGYTIIKDNHLGDWGTQFGKLLLAYKQWGDEQKIIENPITELKDLYVKFHDLAKENPQMEDDARALFVKLEEGDSELMALWKRFRDLSIMDFEKMYKRLGIKFDLYIGESFFIKDAENAVVDCLEKGACKIDDETGAVVVDSDENIPSFLLRKQDGSTLYMSRDLAAMKFRTEVFNPESILYVVGSEQGLNFKQLFALADKTGYLPLSTKAKHIDFGMITVDGKKMSTRKGTLIELEDLLKQSVEKSREILSQKNSALTQQELDEISEIVGVGAILYNDLHQSRIKNISFDWDRMLDLEGGSAAYLQYTYVRIQSILRKLEDAYPGGTKVLNENEISFEVKSEFSLAKKLMMFPQVIAKAQKTDSPHDIGIYLEELTLIFNSFYNEVSIIKTEDVNLRNSRVMLGKATANVIKNGLALLSIRVPEKM
ncbi:MAG: Arginine-tRNA ligase [Parcubacteria group bacterium GW2011_GWD2_38_11]|nr:MAG: Arginine-tRNA ligase [Parcubacteria group bacterium GW2011_GWD2_38_11]